MSFGFEGRMNNNATQNQSVIQENQILHRQIQLINQLTKSVFACKTYPEAIKTTLADICEGEDWIYGEFWIPSLDGKTLQLSESYFATDPDARAFHSISQDIIFPYGIGVPGMVWKDKQSFWSPDMANVVHFHRANYARKFHFQTIYATPLIAEDDFIGVLLFISRDRKEAMNPSILIIDSISRVLAVIIRQKWLEQQILITNEQYRLQLESNLKIILALSRLRDPYTSNHEELVAKVALMVAEHIGISEKQRSNLRIAALIHDIGKMAIPIDILVKPTRLTTEEFMLVKTHSLVGHQIISTLAYDSEVSTIVLQHHERLDGSGYPFGTKGSAIIPCARILAASDVYVAMSEHRPYRPALGHAKAMAELVANRGRLYAEEVVDAFIKLDGDGLLEKIVQS